MPYAPELLPYIKIKVDENRRNGMFFLTGSQMFRLMQNVSESLAGRVGILQLFGFSRAEIFGTMPRALELSAVAGNFFGTYCIAEIIKNSI